MPRETATEVRAEGEARAMRYQVTGLLPRVPGKKTYSKQRQKGKDDRDFLVLWRVED